LFVYSAIALKPTIGVDSYKAEPGRGLEAANGDCQTMILAISTLVSSALCIVFGVVAWGWANGTLQESPQEKVNHQFELIVRRLQS
jgi:hypothetical protein